MRIARTLAFFAPLIFAACAVNEYAQTLERERARVAQLERALDQVTIHFRECQAARMLDQQQRPACHDNRCEAAAPAHQETP